MSCIYCGSKSYGRSCVFSPSQTHAHLSMDRCIYCGSDDVGNGCPCNPDSSTHVRSPESANRNSIQAEKAAVLSYFLQKAAKRTIQEAYKSPLDRFYSRLACIISSSAEPLLESLVLQERSIYSTVSKQQLMECCKVQSSLSGVLKELSDIIKTANNSLPPELVEEALLDAIMANNED